MSEINSSSSIDLYHEKYFLEAVDGFSEYDEFNGEFEKLFERYQRNINLLQLAPEHDYLEFGCGRGEVCIYHALKGGRATGIDYSADAINLAVKKAKSIGVAVDFVTSSFADVQLAQNSYDRILASEFIEHISANEGRRFVKIAYDALRPGGRMLIFTYPNTLQRKIGYPLLRFFKFFQGISLPRQQPDTLDDHYRLYHLNEQNYFGLKKMLVECNFKIIKAGYDTNIQNNKRGYLKGVVLKIIRGTFLRHILFTNLYVIAEK